MEAALKNLKVVDLKAILSQADVQVTTKANKNDLIAKVIANPKAVDVYNKLHNPKSPPQDDLLALPEVFSPNYFSIWPPG